MRWSIVLVALMLAACSDEKSSGEPPDEVRYELQAWATVLPQDVLDAIASKDDTLGTIRFRGAPEIVRARALGDVLVGGKSAATPRGILRAVVSVSADGADTVVETIPVPLPLAFKSFHAKLSRRVADVAAPSTVTGTRAIAPHITPAIHKTSKVVGGSRIFDVEVYNQDLKKETKDDQFIVHAELQGQVGYSAAIDLDWLDDGNVLSQAKTCLEKILKNPLAALDDCVPIPDVKVSFDASLQGNGLLDVDGASCQDYDSGPIYLNDEPWQLPQLVAGPVVITPELDFTARVEGDAATYFHARTEFGYDISVAASAGIKSGVKPPIPKFTKTVSKPVVEVSSSGSSKATFGPRLSLLAYDVFGFYADLHGAGTLVADQAKTPCWDYTLGVELTPGIRLRVPWKKFGLQKLADKLGWNGDIADSDFGTFKLYEDHPFAGLPAEQRACGNPPISALPLGEGPTSEAYQTPTFTPWSFRYASVAARQPYVAFPGSSKSIVEKGHDASWIVSGAYFGAILDLSDKGDVNWARTIEIGLLPDEAKLALEKNAQSVLALAAGDLHIFAAADRFTLLSLEYDGTVAWAKRLRVPEGLPDEELLKLSPVAMTPLPGGDFGILYSRRTVEGADGGDIVLVRTSSKGELRFAKRFRFPTGNTSLAGVLVAVDDDLVLGGLSFQPTEVASYLLRFGKTGALAWAKRVGACDDPRVRLESGTRRASGDLAFVGTFDSAPERTFFTTISPDGEVRGAAGHWSGSILQDVMGVTLAELPTSGFVSMEKWTPSLGNALELSTRDSLGVRTAGKGYTLQNQAGTEIADLRPAGLRLTTDGGALVVAHVTGDKALADYGLWISKIPARTFEAPFDATYVHPGLDAFPNVACTVTTVPATVDVADAPLDGLDVTDIVRGNPVAPQRDAR